VVGTAAWNKTHVPGFWSEKGEIWTVLIDMTAERIDGYENRVLYNGGKERRGKLR
jgi:hypothetical protein